MRIEHYSQEELTRQLLAIVGRYLDMSAYHIFYFGSRVSGKGDERSDIDVGIQGPKPVPFQTLERIREEVQELPTLYTIDVVDFSAAEERFRAVALQHVEHMVYDKP